MMVGFPSRSWFSCCGNRHEPNVPLQGWSKVVRRGSHEARHFLLGMYVLKLPKNRSCCNASLKLVAYGEHFPPKQKAMESTTLHSPLSSGKQGWVPLPASCVDPCILHIGSSGPFTVPHAAGFSTCCSSLSMKLTLLGVEDVDDRCCLPASGGS